MRIRLQWLGIIFFGFLTFSLFFLTPVFAQEQRLDLTVSPFTLDLISSPGGEIKDKIRVRNNSATPIALKIEVQKLVSAGETGEATFTQAKPGDEFINWVKFETPKFIARPREWTDLPYTFNIPKDAAFGYYYSFVISQDKDTTNKDARTIPLTGAIGVTALLNVKSPNAKAEAKLIEFKPVSFINEYLPVDFVVRLENTGNVHIKPRGNIFIRGSQGKDLAVLEANPGMGNILPQGSRLFETSWNDGFLVKEPVVEDGKVKLDSKGNKVTKFTVNWNKITSMRFGKYDAQLLMVFDDGKKDVPIEGKVSFWVIPYMLIAEIIAFLVVLFFILRFLLRRYIKTQLHRNQK